MDYAVPLLMKKGLRVTLGKGPRSKSVVDSIKKFNGIYLVVTGGVGALLAKQVRSTECVAFSDLGAEAVYKLEVKDFPVIVGIDPKGKSIFCEG